MNFISDKPEGFTLPYMNIDKLKEENSKKVPKDFKSELDSYVNLFI